MDTYITRPEPTKMHHASPSYKTALGRRLRTIVPLSEETHDVGLQIVEKFQLSLYDAMIVAAALLAECGTLLSEDLQHGQIFEGRLEVRNPFR